MGPQFYLAPYVRLFIVFECKALQMTTIAVYYYNYHGDPSRISERVD